jgi:hypothetical protein
MRININADDLYESLEWILTIVPIYKLAATFAWSWITVRPVVYPSLWSTELTYPQWQRSYPMAKCR